MDKAKGQGLKASEKFIYSFGTLGKEVSYGMINTYAMLFLTVFMGLNGIIVGFAFCAVRLLSAVADPVMATIVNNTKSPLGKYRPWLIVGALLNTAALVVMFLPFPEFSTGAKYAYYLAAYLVWGVTYTVVDVPLMSMIPSIADTTNERESVSSLSRLIGGFGGFVIGSGGSVIIALTLGQSNPWSYFIVACVGGVILTAMLLLVVCTLKERYVLPCQEVRFREIFSLFKKNDQARAFTGSYLLFTIAATIATLQIVYLFIYDARLSFEYFIIFNVVACTGQGIAMIFYTWITKKLSREKVFSLTYILAMIGLAMIFAAMIPGFILQKESDPLVNVIIVSIAGSFLMTASGVNQISSMVMISDVCDYGEYKLGVRTDAVMMSVQTLLLKISGAVAMLVLGIGIYVSGLPTINLLTNTFSGEVTDKMILILLIFMFLVPIPLLPIGLIYYKKKYRLFGKYYDEVKASIDLKRKEAGAACDEAAADRISDDC